MLDDKIRLYINPGDASDNELIDLFLELDVLYSPFGRDGFDYFVRDERNGIFAVDAYPVVSGEEIEAEINASIRA